MGKQSRTRGQLTEAGVLGEELGELVTLVLAVAAVAAVAVGRDADFGRAQVVGSHHGACREEEAILNSRVHQSLSKSQIWILCCKFY